jgi:hypothetical protein
MKWLRITSCFCLLVLSLVAFAFVAVHPAYGQATVVRFEFQTPVSGLTALPECLPPELIGMVSGTETTVGQFTATNQGFNVHGTTTFDYQVDFPDGRYVLGTAFEHFDFNINFQSGQTTNTDVIREPRTIYNASGQPIGNVVIHALSHITFRDANGNGQPDPSEITANVDNFRFTCY